MIRNRLSLVVMIFMLASAQPARVFGETVDVAPEPVQAALFVKLLAFHKGIDREVSVHVIGSAVFAAELKKIIGVRIGNSSLVKVTSDDALPASPPSVVYIGKSTLLEEITHYTRKNKILSITGIPDLVPKGVTLGIGVSGGKPRILLNVSASKEEGIPWDHAILKVSKTF